MALNSGALVLKRIHRGSRYGDYLEVIDEDPELGFYGSSVAEGICPDLHDEDDLVEDGSRDRRARRLSLGRDGWLHCEDGCPPWRFEHLG
jgi:hypothetical protein